MCGYADAAYFSRMFRKVTGQMPSKYQQFVQNTLNDFPSA